MTVTQMINANGNPAANQFILIDGEKQILQSYETTIAVKNAGRITVDTKALDYSKTTSKHLFIFLDMNRKEIEQGIKEGAIKVEDLN